MEAERLRTENRNLKQQVSDMRAQINVGEKPLRQRIEQLETRCKKLKTEAESLPQLMESIKKADALSAAVLAEFDYVRDKHPETKDWFFIGKYILDYVDDDGAERYLIEEIHTGVPCHVYASTIKAVT